jgi:hypothetical protein
MKHVLASVAILAAGCITGCGWTGGCGPAPTREPVRAASFVELAPGLRLDRAARIIEIDGIVPIDAHDPKKPVVYLEWLVCTPDTKEHESLVMTRVKPSLVHAALLSIGLEPGSPGAWEWSGKTLIAKPPTGPRVPVLVRTPDAPPVHLASWVKDRRTGARLFDAIPTDGFVFAGSRIVERSGQSWYQADREGGLVGLTCFGHELLAWSRMFNPDASAEEPVWMADPASVPPQGTAVTVVIEAM